MSDPKQQRSDAVDELAELLIVMRRQTSQTDSALRRIESSRFNLLVVHAIAALLISVLMMASEPSLVGPAWAYLQRIPFFPYSFASVLCIGGLVLLPGSIGKSRWLEIIGLSCVYIWYFALAVGFAIPTFSWGFTAINSWLDEKALPPDRPALYTWVVYLHLAIIMRVHLWTLSRLRRQDRELRAMRDRERGVQ